MFFGVGRTIKRMLALPTCLPSLLINSPFLNLFVIMGLTQMKDKNMIIIT